MGNGSAREQDTIVPFGRTHPSQSHPSARREGAANHEWGIRRRLQFVFVPPPAQPPANRLTNRPRRPPRGVATEFYTPEFAAECEARERARRSLFLAPDQLPYVPGGEWVVRDLIAAKEVVLLAGNPKEGKSCLATAIALAVASGTPFAGMPTEQAGVLWMAYEESVHERGRVMFSSPLLAPDLPLYTCFERVPLDSDEFVAVHNHWVNETGARLIVVDPLLAAADRPLDRPHVARKVLENVRLVSGLATVLLLHHKKGPNELDRRERVADNAQLEATCTTGIVMRAQRAADHRLVTLHCRSRRPEGNQILHLLSDGPLDYQVAVEQRSQRSCPAPDRSGWQARVATCVLDLLRESGPLTSAEIANQTSVRIGTVRNVLTRLRRSQEIRFGPKEGYAHRYEAVPERDESPAENARG